MPSHAPSNLTAWTLLSLPLLLVVGACYAFLGNEAAVAASFAAWRPEHGDAVRLITLYTNWGNPAVYLVYAGILARGLRHKRRDLTAFALAYLAGQLLISAALGRMLKVGLGRPRPGVGGPFIPWSLDAAHNSLPSGHSTEMTLQTAPLALRARGWLTPLLLGLSLGLMAASRIILGAHHPSDVLGGFMLGGLVALFIQWLAPRLSNFLAARLPETWSV